MVDAGTGLANVPDKYRKEVAAQVGGPAAACTTPAGIGREATGKPGPNNCYLRLCGALLQGVTSHLPAHPHLHKEQQLIPCASPPPSSPLVQLEVMRRLATAALSFQH